VKVTADTNVLVRALTGDDARQSAIACDVLAKADLVAVLIAHPFPCHGPQMRASRVEFAPVFVA
jgi:hypothetical protein